MPSDADLIARSIADPSCFAHLYDRHGRAIHAYLARRTGAVAADDLFAEVWLQALHSRGRFDPKVGDARPWLFGIARNVLRASRRSTRRTEPLAELPDVDVWADVDVRLDAVRLAPDLRDALSVLSAAELEVLLLIAWEDLSPAAVAEILGVPRGTVRWRLHRARALTRGHLARPPVEARELGTALGGTR